MMGFSFPLTKILLFCMNLFDMLIYMWNNNELKLTYDDCNVLHHVKALSKE